MVSSQVPLPASYGTHTPGRRTTRTVRLPRPLTPSRFSTSAGQTRREPRVYCSPTTRSGLRYIHHNHIPRLILVGNARLARAVPFRQHTQPFSASASPSSSCSLLDLRSFATLLVKSRLYRTMDCWTISPISYLLVRPLIDINSFMHLPTCHSSTPQSLTHELCTD